MPRTAKTSGSTPASNETEAPAGIGVWIGTALVLGLFGMVPVMGLLTTWAGLRLLVTGEKHWGIALLVTAIGVAISALGFGFFYVRYVKEPMWRARERAIAARYPGQPWMQRADWAARKVTDSSLGLMLLLWFWVVCWWGAIVFIWSVNRDKILAGAGASYWEAALGLMFPLCGLLGLWFAWQATRTWMRFGRSTLRIDTLPGYLGERFRGTLEANFRTRPAALEAELICEYVEWQTRRRNGKNTSERVTTRVWSATHAVETSRMVLGGRGGAGGPGAMARVDINVPLPADQPPCELDAGGNGIIWRLMVREPDDAAGSRAKAGAAGVTGGKDADAVPFSATFEVPVFRR